MASGNSVGSGGALHYTTVDPSAPGLYFECKCREPECQLFDVLVYAFIGDDGSFDFKTETANCVCSRCRKKVGPINGVALKKCLWSYNGELNDGSTKESEVRVAQSNYHLVEIETYSWKWLNLTVHPVSETQVPIKRRHSSDSDSESRDAIKEEPKPSAIEPTNSVLKLQAAGFPSIEVIREDVQRKQEIIDILRAETKHKEKEKRTLEVKVQKLREEVRSRQVERLKKAKSNTV